MVGLSRARTDFCDKVKHRFFSSCLLTSTYSFINDAPLLSIYILGFEYTGCAFSNLYIKYSV